MRGIRSGPCAIQISAYLTPLIGHETIESHFFCIQLDETEFKSTKYEKLGKNGRLSFFTTITLARLKSKKAS